MNFSPILAGVKASWTNVALLALANIYFGRAAQPNSYAGFPYMELSLKTVGTEISTIQGDGTNLVTYELTARVYNVQGQTGGSTTGNPATDCYNLQVALDAMLAGFPPNTPWEGIDGFLHCIPTPQGDVDEDPMLFNGRDVYIYKNSWQMLIGE